MILNQYSFTLGLWFTIGGSFFSRMASGGGNAANEMNPADRADPKLLKKARETPKGTVTTWKG